METYPSEPAIKESIVSEDHNQSNETKREYTEAERLISGLYAIEHLIENYAPSLPVGNAYDTLVKAARAEYHRARERNLTVNGWVFEYELSPLINPDYTDPDKRRAVVVSVTDAEEGDLEVETAGPFPMFVQSTEDGEIRTIRSEEELIQHFEEFYGGAVTTIRPMPFASLPQE